MSYSSNNGGTCYSLYYRTHVRSQILKLQKPRRISSWDTRKHTTKSYTRTKGSRVRPTSQAYSDADPCLVCPAAAVAAAVVAAATTSAAAAAAAADDYYFLLLI